MTLQHRFTDAEAIGQQACDKRDAGHRQVESCEEKPDLSVRKPEIILIERRQGIDAVLRARSEDVRHTYQSENRPSKIIAPLGDVGQWIPYPAMLAFC